MVCLLFAMEKEASELLKNVEILENRCVGYTEIFEVEKDEKKFLVAISGIGKGFAASAIASIANLYKVDSFINVGVAGSQNKAKADIFSAVIGDQYVEHDMDTSAIGDPKGLISGINMVYLPGCKSLMEVAGRVCKGLSIPYVEGTISSGDTFLSEGEKKKSITEEFGSLCLDMESAPFAQIASVFHVPFCAIRVISDAEHPEVEYPLNVKKCSEIASQIALAMALRLA